MNRNISLHYRVLGLLIFGATLALYLKTVAPTVSFWDCGEFISCSYILGVPHPPGAPLYVLLGRLFSLIPFGEIAWRVNLMSMVPSALGIWFVYLSTVSLARRALGGEALQPFGDIRDYSVMAGAALASLALAVSYTYWFNSVEAEVYGYSIFFATLGLWIIVYWEGTQHGTGNDRWLFLIAYLFGLGGGIHLLCLLTIPSLVILAWYADERLRRLIVALFIVGGWAGLTLLILGPGSGSNGALGFGLLAALYYLYSQDRRSCWLLLGAMVLFGLGYSTYAALLIRSGLDPAIDENDPENLGAFLKFLNREQYGTDSQLLGVFQARAARTYQFWHLQMKYFFQQWPIGLPVLEKIVEFRRATDTSMEQVNISLIPYGLGLAGMIWHFQRDRQRFWAILALFVVMGFGLSIYLNMPDPQPRERHYVFGGMFCAFALWMGMAWTGLMESVRNWMSADGRRMPGWLHATIALVALLLPVGVGANLYHIHDRTDNRIAYDYAYNILNSCEENSLLFTNGDNDTFPLWFLQEVEGIRRDVRVINLSLLNTNWYIKQLRDREPKVDIRLNDTFIDSILTDTEDRDLYKRLWEEPKVPKEFKEMGFDVEVSAPPGNMLLRVQDLMMIGIIRWNDWKKPINIAITVATHNRLNLDPYLRMDGMTLRLMPDRSERSDVDRLSTNLREVYQYRGVIDPLVYKDDNTARLLGNYHAIVLHLAGTYQANGQTEELRELFEWASETIYSEWDSYYTASSYLREMGQRELAARFLAKAGLLLLGSYGEGGPASYGNLIALGSILVNDYAAFDEAMEIYRGLIEKTPKRWDAYYEMAATMQARGDIQGALDMLAGYRAEYGQVASLDTAEQILRDALEYEQVLQESAGVPGP